MIDLNATQAAIRAGYSKNTATEIGCQNLMKVNIQEHISKLLDKRNKRLDIDADYVLERLRDFDTLNIKDILNDGGDIKPVSEWPDVWCTSISGIDIAAISSKEDAEAIIKKIKWPDKVKNLEMMGRHINVQAWQDKIELTDDKDIMERLLRGRSRMNDADDKE